MGAAIGALTHSATAAWLAMLFCGRTDEQKPRAIIMTTNIRTGPGGSSSKRIHKALAFQIAFDPLGQPTSQPIVIIVFAHVVRPHFSKQNKLQAKTMFATGETVGLA